MLIKYEHSYKNRTIDVLTNILLSNLSINKNLNNYLLIQCLKDRKLNLAKFHTHIILNEKEIK